MTNTIFPCRSSFGVVTRSGFSIGPILTFGRGFNFMKKTRLTACRNASNNPARMSNTTALPEPLRKQLSEAGRKGAAKLTFEQRSAAGKRGWEVRKTKALAEMGLNPDGTPKLRAEGH